MYRRFIGSAINKNVKQSTARVYPSTFFSSLSTHPTHKDSNLVDDIRPGSESESGSGSGSGSGIDVDDRVNVVKVKSSATPSYSASERRNNDGDTASFVADTAKQGVAKAMETGLEIGEMAKKTLDNVWDITKDTTNMFKDAVTGDPEEKNDVPPTDQFVDDLRKRADGYDLKNKKDDRLRGK